MAFAENYLPEDAEPWPGSHVPGSVRLPPTFVAGFHDRAAVELMKYSPLGRTGMIVSVLGLGGSALGGAYGEVAEQEAARAALLALRSGVNYIDTAVWYGQGRSEALLGRLLAQVPRQAYYIATKCCRYETEPMAMFDFSAARTQQSVDESLERLGTGYVDVIQVHDPEFCDTLSQVLNETLPALAEVKAARKARFIGITGYPLSVQREILERSTVDIDSSLCYCHYGLNDRTLASDFLPYLEARGVGVINASALGMGLLSDAGPPKWHPAPEAIREACREAAAYCQARGLAIAKLALHFSLHSCERLPICLVSTHVYDYMVMNLDAVASVLTPEEEAATQHLIENIFGRLEQCSWEGIEVAKYRRKLEKH